MSLFLKEILKDIISVYVCGVSRYKRTPCEWPNVILKLWAVICCYNSPHSSGKTPCKSISEVSRHPVLDPVGVRALSRPHHLSVLYKPCANHCLKHESVLMWHAILKVYLGVVTKNNLVRVGDNNLKYLVEVWKTIWHATPYVHILGQVKSSHGLCRVELQVPSQATPKVLTLGTGTMTMIWFDPWTIR